MPETRETNIPLLPRLLGWRVRLPLPVVVVYEGAPSTRHLSIGFTVASQLAVFYRPLGIEIQPQVSARTLPLWPSDRRWVDEVLRVHRFHLGGIQPTLIVRSDVSMLQGDSGMLWGEAFESVAVSVGQDGRGVLHRYAVEIAIHEVGHLLGLDHQKGTFMDPAIQWLREHPVTSEQRRRMREAAFRLGGF